MRVWDVPPAELCSRHLLGEHGEIHAVWSVIRHEKRGYALHPEVTRWRGNLPALAVRHNAVVSEMQLRGYNHASPLPNLRAEGATVRLLDSLERQRQLLLSKDCICGSIAKDRLSSD